MSVQHALRIGIIGCGQMGRKHGTNCLRLDGVSVAAVADVASDRAKALAAELRATPFTSPDELLAKATLDAIIVATPPAEHRQVAEAAASRGVAVLVEKPIALDLASAQAMCAAVKGGSVVNAVGFHLRYSPLMQLARSLIKGRVVTNVRSVTTTSYYLKMDMPLWFLQRRHSGGPLLEQSLHVFDAARYLAGDITHVAATGGRIVHPEVPDVDSEDVMALAYRFSSGALGTHLDSCAMEEFNWEVEVFGTDWRLLVDFARNRLRGRLDGETFEKTLPTSDWHVLELEAFVVAVRGGRTDGILSDFADATRTLAVMLAGDRALRSAAWEPATW